MVFALSSTAARRNVPHPRLYVASPKAPPLFGSTTRSARNVPYGVYSTSSAVAAMPSAVGKLPIGTTPSDSTPSAAESPPCELAKVSR